MNFVQHPSNTRVIGAPETLKISDPADPLYVAALPITDAVEHGQAIMQSVWLPEPDELEALKAGRPVLLTIWGSVHPVVRLGVVA